MPCLSSHLKMILIICSLSCSILHPTRRFPSIQSRPLIAYAATSVSDGVFLLLYWENFTLQFNLLLFSYCNISTIEMEFALIVSLDFTPKARRALVNGKILDRCTFSGPQKFLDCNFSVSNIYRAAVFHKFLKPHF